MYIKFKSICLKNILSFGNKNITFLIKNGLNLITGNNGVGKSSILLDTISFCLFGEPYRNIKIEELVNRKNKNNLEITCILNVDNDEFEITRGLKPSKIEIKKNKLSLNLLSSKTLIQNEINKIIGIDYKTFKHVVSLSINYNEPFFKLSSSKKRELIENIFSINIFSDMLKNIKEQIKTLKIDIDIVNKSIILLKNIVDTDKDRLNKFIEIEKKFEINKQNEILKINKQIEIIKEKLLNIKNIGQELSKNKCDKNNNDLNNELNELNIVIKKLNNNIITNEINIKNINKTIDFLKNNNICQQCKHELTEKYKNQEIIKLKNTINDYNNNILNNNKKLLIYNEKNKIINDEINKIIIKNNELKQLKVNAISLNNELNNLYTIQNDIKNRTFEFNIENEIEKVNENNKNYDYELNKYNKFNNELKYLKIVEESLSDTGIKSFVYDEIIQILNYNINEYLKLFELPINIKFDKYMNENIKLFDNNSDNISYNSFSEGEKKRIDISILLSFISIRKILANWNCNLIVIDEILDTSIDEIGLTKLIECMKKMINENQLGIYIVSHRLKKEYMSQFDNLIEIVKNGNGFSNINQIEKCENYEIC